MLAVSLGWRHRWIYKSTRGRVVNKYITFIGCSVFIYGSTFLFLPIKEVIRMGYGLKPKHKPKMEDLTFNKAKNSWLNYMKDRTDHIGV